MTEVKDFKQKDMPRIGEHNSDVEFEIGDRVTLDFGKAGQLGPGEVVSKLKWEEKNYEDFIGYVVRLEINSSENMDFGWVGSSLLTPAGKLNYSF